MLMLSGQSFHLQATLLSLWDVIGWWRRTEQPSTCFYTDNILDKLPSEMDIRRKGKVEQRVRE